MTTEKNKTDSLHEIARNYVLKGLGEKNFDAIPYVDDVTLRAPLCPCGSEKPLTGKENLRQQWWAPLPSILGNVKFIDSYVNSSETAVTAEFHLEFINPVCTFRILDRFTINDEGKIISQENFYDPRDLTNPGWNK